MRLLVSRREAAEMLGICTRSWDRLVAALKTPEPIRLGGRILWRVSDLEEWVRLGRPDRNRFEVLKDDGQPK